MEISDIKSIFNRLNTNLDKIFDIRILSFLEKDLYLISLGNKILRAIIKGEVHLGGSYKAKIVETKPNLIFKILDVENSKNDYEMFKDFYSLLSKDTDIKKLLRTFHLIEKNIKDALGSILTKNNNYHFEGLRTQLSEKSNQKQVLNLLKTALWRGMGHNPASPTFIENTNMQLIQLIYNNVFVLYFIMPQLNIFDGKIFIKKIKHNYYRLIICLLFSNLGQVYVTINYSDYVCDVIIKSDIDISDKIKDIHIPNIKIKWKPLNKKVDLTI